MVSAACRQRTVPDLDSQLQISTQELYMNKVLQEKQQTLLRLCRHGPTRTQDTCLLTGQTTNVHNKWASERCSRHIPIYFYNVVHFSSPRWCVAIEIRRLWQKCQSENEGEKGVWNRAGNYVLQLRHAEEILKAILQCLGTGCRKGRCDGRRQFNQNPLSFGGGRETMFNSQCAGMYNIKGCMLW